MAPLFLIVSAPGRGKTTAVDRLAGALRVRGLTVGGILQRPLEGLGRRAGYDLVDIATEETLPFARRRPTVGGGHGAFAFDEAGWPWAAARIQAARRGADVLLVDEIGRLEAAGSGHLPALLAPVPGERARAWVLAVRDLAVPAVIEALGPPAARVEAPVGEEEIGQLAGAISGYPVP
ncbi:MAG: nucleoside-triphosphatase [Pseudomonadota bacterium]